MKGGQGQTLVTVEPTMTDDGDDDDDHGDEQIDWIR